MSIELASFCSYVSSFNFQLPDTCLSYQAYIEAQRDLQCEHVTQEIVNEVVVKIMRGFASNAILDEKMDIEK